MAAYFTTEKDSSSSPVDSIDWSSQDSQDIASPKGSFEKGKKFQRAGSGYTGSPHMSPRHSMRGRPISRGNSMAAKKKETLIYNPAGKLTPKDASLLKLINPGIKQKGPEEETQIGTFKNSLKKIAGLSDENNSEEKMEVKSPRSQPISTFSPTKSKPSKPNLELNLGRHFSKDLETIQSEKNCQSEDPEDNSAQSFHTIHNQSPVAQGGQTSSNFGFEISLSNLDNKDSYHKARGGKKSLKRLRFDSHENVSIPLSNRTSSVIDAAKEAKEAKETQKSSANAFKSRNQLLVDYPTSAQGLQTQISSGTPTPVLGKVHSRQSKNLATNGNSQINVEVSQVLHGEQSQKKEEKNYLYYSKLAERMNFSKDEDVWKAIFNTNKEDEFEFENRDRETETPKNSSLRKNEKSNPRRMSESYQIPLESTPSLSRGRDQNLLKINPKKRTLSQSNCLTLPKYPRLANLSSIDQIKDHENPLLERKEKLDEDKKSLFKPKNSELKNYLLDSLPSCTPSKPMFQQAQKLVFAAILQQRKSKLNLSQSLGPNNPENRENSETKIGVEEGVRKPINSLGKNKKDKQKHVFLTNLEHSGATGILNYIDKSEEPGMQILSNALNLSFLSNLGNPSTISGRPMPGAHSREPNPIQGLMRNLTRGLAKRVSKEIERGQFEALNFTQKSNLEQNMNILEFLYQEKKKCLAFEYQPSRNPLIENDVCIFKTHGLKQHLFNQLVCFQFINIGDYKKETPIKRDDINFNCADKSYFPENLETNPKSSAEPKKKKKRGSLSKIFSSRNIHQVSPTTLNSTHQAPKATKAQKEAELPNLPTSVPQQAAQGGSFANSPLPGQSAHILVAKFSPDGFSLALGSEEGCVIVMEAEGAEGSFEKDSHKMDLFREKGVVFWRDEKREGEDMCVVDLAWGIVSVC